MNFPLISWYRRLFSDNDHFYVNIFDHLFVLFTLRVILY